MSVRDNITDGVYEDLPYPGRPAVPALLRKKAMDLTKDELEALTGVVEKHTLAIATYEAAKTNYEADRIFKHKRFESDLANEFHIPLHKHRKRIFDKAWEQGHSEGLDRVAQIYEELAELLK